MSALLYYIDQEQAIIATDTLSVYPDGTFKSHCSKALALPHMRLVVAVTGFPVILNRWVAQLNDQSVAFDISSLDEHVSVSLQDTWRGIQQDYSIDESMPVTVYHFGFSQAHNEIRGYAYRANNHFASERLAYGMRVYPYIPLWDTARLPEDAVRIMQAQIEAEERKNEDYRIHIGGEVQIIHQTKSGAKLYSMWGLPLRAEPHFSPI